jgi:hypothetical protein
MRAINTLSNERTDENSTRVKCALRAIKDFLGASSISPSFAPTIAARENDCQDKILSHDEKPPLGHFMILKL